MRRIISLVGIVAASYCHAGNPDSLDARLRAEGRTTKRVDLLIERALLLAGRPDMDLTATWNEAQALSIELRYEKGLAYAPMGPAMRLWRAGGQIAAADSMLKCVERLDALGVDQHMASPLGWLCEVYSSAGMQEERLRYYTGAVARYRDGPLRMSLGTSYHALAGYYMHIGQYGAAIEHYMRARDCYSGNPGVQCNETMVIGWAYERWGNPTKAIPFIREAIDCMADLRDTTMITENRLHLAAAQLALGDTLAAMHELRASRTLWQHVDTLHLALFRSQYIHMLLQLGRVDEAGQEYAQLVRDHRQVAVPLVSKDGKCEVDYCGYAYYAATGRNVQADSSLREALKKALRINDLPLVLKYRKAMMGRSMDAGDLAGAAKQAGLYVRLNDSLQAMANAGAVAAYEGLVKEREGALEIQRQHAQVKQQRVVLLATAAVLLLLAALGWSVYRGKKRSDELLLNILPAEVAQELKATGSSEARHIEQATILFTDFKGFTELSEKLTPQELVHELDTCFKAFDAIITARGIEKIKTIGDAYMAAGGLRRQMPSGVRDVVDAALDMQAFMVRRKAERTAGGKPAFDMRVGIHTGPVVAGIVGVKKFQYDIWGDTVNTASRMETSGEIGRVNISASTHAALSPVADLVFGARGKVSAKGKGELEMYFVRRSGEQADIVERN